MSSLAALLRAAKVLLGAVEDPVPFGGDDAEGTRCPRRLRGAVGGERRQRQHQEERKQSCAQGALLATADFVGADQLIPKGLDVRCRRLLARHRPVGSEPAPPGYSELRMEK